MLHLKLLADSLEAIATEWLLEPRARHLGLSDDDITLCEVRVIAALALVFEPLQMNLKIVLDVRLELLY